MKYYVSPATSTMPDLAGTTITLLPCLYEGSTNQYYTSRVTNHLKCLAPDGNGVYDADACDSIAADYLSGGVDKIVLDWERPDSQANRAAYLRVMWRLQDRGLTVSRFGCEPWASSWDRLYTGAANSNEIHCVFYQFTLDTDLWLYDRGRKLDAIKKAHPGKSFLAWVWPFHENDGDGPGNGEIPRHQYVGDAMWKAELAFLKRRNVSPVLWTGAERLTPQGDYGPFPEDHAFWQIYKEAAK